MNQCIKDSNATHHGTVCDMSSHSITSYQLDKAYREDELLIKELLLAKIMNRD